MRKLHFALCLAAQLIGSGDELFHLVLGSHLGDGLVDAGQQALGVALGNSDAVGLRFTELGGSGSDDQIGVGLCILLSDSAVDDDRVDLAVDKLVDEVSHKGEGDEVRAFHLVGDDGFLGGGGLCADALAGEVGEGVVLIGGISLDKDHGRQVGVVGIGEVSGLETLGRDLDGCHDDIKIALGKGGEQVVEAHVLDLKLLAQLIGDVLAGRNVDTGVLHRAAVIGIHEFVRGVVSGGAEHQRAAGLLGVVVGVGIIGMSPASFFNFSFLPKYGVYFLQALGYTLLLAVISVLLAVIPALLLAFMRLSKNKFVRGISGAYIAIFRSTPLLVQLSIIYFGFFGAISIPRLYIFGFIDISRFIPGVVALALNSSAYVAEIFRAGILAVDAGQTEAARSLGLSATQAMKLVVLPQAIKNVLPALGNEVVTMVKESSICSTLGMVELMFAAKTVATSTYISLAPYVLAALMYFCITYPAGKAIEALERRMRRGDKH